MNILITGYLDTIASGLVQEFTRDEKNKIILAGVKADEFDLSAPNVVLHSIDPAEPGFEEIISAYRLDALVYLPVREEHILTQKNIRHGKILDGLLHTLELCKAINNPRFIFFSSTEVFDKTDFTSGKNIQQSDACKLNKNFLLTGEQYCRFYNKAYGLKTTIVRVPFTYAIGDTTSFLASLIEQCNEEKEVRLPAPAAKACSFLHAEDIADFVRRLLDEEYLPEFGIFDLSPIQTTTMGALGKQLKEKFPEVTIHYAKQTMLGTQPVKGDLAKKALNWINYHTLDEDLDDIILNLGKLGGRKVSLLARLKEKINFSPKISKWVELILGGVIMQLAVYLTGTFIQFKYIDFRLLYVILIGSTYGIRFGLLAAVIATASNLYSWYQLGLDWELLLYHVENWLPFALYLITGAVTGYVWDKKENETNFANQQVKLIQEKYSFLYNIYSDIRNTKDRLREQLIGYRDSYGRIYSISRELDSLNSNDIYLKALDIIEDVMENKSAAIYTVDPSMNFARLEVSSVEKTHDLSKSLDLSRLPKAASRIKEGKLYQNQTLEPDHPAYIFPVMNENMPVALIAIWEASLEQFDMYHENLFQVVCGLVESALLRATLFTEANLARWYLPSTHILVPEKFTETLRIKYEMRNKNINDFQLLRIDKGKRSWEELSKVVSKGIRTTDYAGLLKQEDMACYVILSQAMESDVDMIISRLAKLELDCLLIKDEVLTNV